jgi:hypothetical protein
MKKHKGAKTKAKATQLIGETQPDSAEVDIAANEIWVAVPAERTQEPVRRFGAFTRELKQLVSWLLDCGVRSVAMESTGVYWIPLFQLREEAGLKMCLVNARHVKNVPGRKSDVRDCQWLQYLHSVGLLRGSFRPAQAICATRSIYRYRQELLSMAGQHIQHMQSALEQMNVKLHHVIDDLTEVTGQAMVEAILSGQRDPVQLAKLRDKRIQACESILVKPWKRIGAKNTSSYWQRRGITGNNCINRFKIAIESSWTTPTSLKPAPRCAGRLRLCA